MRLMEKLNEEFNIGWKTLAKGVTYLSENSPDHVVDRYLAQIDVLSKCIENHIDKNYNWKLIEADNFIKDVEKDKKVDEPEGFFTSNSASAIASKSEKDHETLGKAIQSLNYAKSRAGKNMSDDIVKKIDKAIEILQAKNEKEKAKESFNRKNR